MQAGLWANVRIGTKHTHSLVAMQTIRFLQDKDGHLRDLFFEYFWDSMTASDARKYHESLLFDQGASEIDLGNGSRNPTADTVNYWFNQWRNIHFGPRSGKALLDVGLWGIKSHFTIYLC